MMRQAATSPLLKVENLVVEYAVDVLTVEVMTVNYVPSSRLF